MPVVIQESTATMTAAYAGARPDVFYDQNTDQAVLHQTRHSGPVLAGKMRSAAQASAIRVTASVTVAAGNLADIQSQYEFHLLQLAWKPIDYALYAGRTPSDGSMKLDFVAPPLYPAANTFLLDADETGASPFPFIEFGGAKIRATAAPGIWLVSLVFDDHPFATRKLAFPNFATPGTKGGTNFLFELSRSLFFYTVFVVKDTNTGTIKPLGYLNWKSRLLAKIRWRTDPANGDAVPDPAQLVTSTFTSDGYMRGSPGGAPGRMIANPPTDPRVTYNAIEKANVVAILGSTSNSPSIQASATRSASVPATHFAP
jgi:hypothetical protein